nr:hypothetical protein [Desulfobacula sp.]
MGGFPAEGYGIRYLWCKNYDKCLYKAGVKEWHGFNCEACDTPDLGDLVFIRPALIPDFNDDELFSEEDQEVEMIDLKPNHPAFSFFKELEDGI